MQNNLFSKALDIAPGTTAFVGGGGKTSLIMALADELCQEGKVAICTTTRMWLPGITRINPASIEELRETYETSNPIAIGVVAPEGKMAMPDFDLRMLETCADYVLVEADGSRGLSAKAPAGHEPCIPDFASHVVAVFGIDAINVPIAEAAHRPELYADLLDASLSARITPSMAAEVLASRKGQRKGVGDRKFSIFINKADDQEALALGLELCARIPSGIRTAVGAAKRNRVVSVRF